MYFAIGDLLKVASRPRAEMFIVEGKIYWVEVLCYLGVIVCCGKYFRADSEKWRRKFLLQLMVLFLINLHCLKNVICKFWEYNVFKYWLMLLVCGNAKTNSYVNLVHHLIMLWEKCSIIEDLNLLKVLCEIFYMLPLEFFIDRKRL